MLKVQSQLSLGRKRVLETIRKAAYYPKKLNKFNVHQTDIPFSVDTILQEQVHCVTYRVLGYLLLGIVRIYSKKVQYTYDYCDKLLSEINEFGGRKKTYTSNEAIYTPYVSITRPTSFQLDAFDLQIAEERTSSHLRLSEELMLEEARNDAGYSYHSLDKNHSHIDGVSSGTFSAAFTPFQDVLSFQFMESEIMASAACPFSASEASIENLRDNNSFMLDEIMDPITLGDVQEQSQQNDEEQMRACDVEEYADVDEGPSSVNAYDTMETILLPVMGSPESMTNHQASVTINATPKIKDLNGSGTLTPDSMAIQTPTANKVMVSPESATDHQASVTIHTTPEIKYLNGSGTLTPDLMVIQTPTANKVMVSPESAADYQASVTVHATPEIKDLNGSGTLTPDLMVIHTPTANKVMVSPESVTDHQASVTIHATPESKDLNGSETLTPDFMAVQTPAAKERGRFSKKRKCLLDDICVLPGSVIKENIADPSDLIRPRRQVPSKPLHVWKVQKIANLAHNFSEPLMACSSKLESVLSFTNIKKVQVAEAIEAPGKLNLPESPILHRSPEQAMNAPESPIIHQFQEQILNVLVDPINHRSPEPEDIAPSTPITTISSSMLHDGPRRTVSFDSLEEERNNDNNEFDISHTIEDISSSAGDSWEMDKWSVRTRSDVAPVGPTEPRISSVAHQIWAQSGILDHVVQKCYTYYFGQHHGEHLLRWRGLFVMAKQGNGEHISLNYTMTLPHQQVLKSGGYVDVKQHTPYDDIIVSGTCKLNSFCDF